MSFIVLPALYIIIKDLIKLFKFSRKNKEEDYKVSEKDNINEALATMDESNEKQMLSMVLFKNVKDNIKELM